MGFSPKKYPWDVADSMLGLCKGKISCFSKMPEWRGLPQMEEMSDFSLFKKHYENKFYEKLMCQLLNENSVCSEGEIGFIEDIIINIWHWHFLLLCCFFRLGSDQICHG
jgi:hypothetical protein